MPFLPPNQQRQSTVFIITVINQLGQYQLLLCVCVSLSQCRRSIETNGRIKLVYGTTLPSNYPTLCYKKIRDFGCLQNDRLTVLSFGTFSETLDLKILLWQVDRVVNKTHRQSS